MQQGSNNQSGGINELEKIIQNQIAQDKDAPPHSKTDLTKTKKNDLFLICLMICSNLRNLRYYSSLTVAFEMLQNFSVYLGDPVKLHLIIPYLFSLFEDQPPRIVAQAFEVSLNILLSIRQPIMSNSERTLFNDYIKPNLMKVY